MDLCFTIPSHLAGQRLDQVISDHLAGCSRSRAAALIQDGSILVDDRPRRPAYRVKAGQRVTGTFPEPEADVPSPSPWHFPFFTKMPISL